jgi:hypothetical protein
MLSIRKRNISHCSGTIAEFHYDFKFQEKVRKTKFRLISHVNKGRVLILFTHTYTHTHHTALVLIHCSLSHILTTILRNERIKFLTFCQHTLFTHSFSHTHTHEAYYYLILAEY